jgi:hypothetical protein
MLADDMSGTRIGSGQRQELIPVRGAREEFARRARSVRLLRRNRLAAREQSAVAVPSYTVLGPWRDSAPRADSRRGT